VKEKKKKEEEEEEEEEEEKKKKKNSRNNFHIIFKDPRFCVAITELSNTVDRAQA
jgi:hypothetical protein